MATCIHIHIPIQTHSLQWKSNKKKKPFEKERWINWCHPLSAHTCACTNICTRHMNLQILYKFKNKFLTNYTFRPLTSHQSVFLQTQYKKHSILDRWISLDPQIGEQMVSFCQGSRDASSPGLLRDTLCRHQPWIPLLESSQWIILTRQQRENKTPKPQE